MFGLDNILVLVVVAGAMVLFATEKLRPDLTALCVLVALVVFRLIEPGQALSGFANSATATIACMFVLSAGLVRTGLVEWLARRMDTIAGKTQRQLVLVLCLAAAFLSAFIVNTAVVAIFIPMAMSLAASRKVPVSRVLIPLSYASQFGGVCTLIGTSSNLLVNSIALSSGLAGFGLFEFAPLGLIISAVGILYLVSLSPWLLPKRKGLEQQVDKYRLSDYLAEFTLKKNSPLAGKKWGGLNDKDLKNVNLIKLIRRKKAVGHPAATVMREGDVLLLYGNADTLLKVKNNYGLESAGDGVIDDQKLSSDEVKLVETLVPPGSSLSGKILGSLDFARRYGGVVLAMQRRGKVLRDRLADIRLDNGDTLLLQCDKEGVGRLMKSSDLVVTSEWAELHVRKDKAALALGIVGLVVFLATFQIFPIFVAALIGVVSMLLGRCLSLEEAYQSIDWKVIFLLGGIIPLGLALQQTGTAALLAGKLMGPSVRLGPLAVLAILYLTTALLTEGMSNNAAVILLSPIALSLSGMLGANPKPFLVAITFAASTSFATPIGYQTNTMVYAPGGYRFSDFIRAGGPLNLLFWITVCLFLPLLWRF